MKTYYKIVEYNTVNKTRCSAFGFNLSFLDIVFYGKDITVFHKQNCGPLCVFDDYWNARSFYQERCKSSIDFPEKYHEIWECEILESRCDGIWDSTAHYEYIYDLPFGTILAKWVTLKKKIYDGKSEEQ